MKNLYVVKLLFYAIIMLFMASCTNTTDNNYRIGVAAPFSGQEGVAVYGKNIKQAIELAKEEINKTGGIKGKELSFIYEDTKLIPSTAVNAVTKLATLDKVDIIIGAVGSSSTVACSKVADQYMVILISPASTSNKISGISPYVFRTIAPDIYEGEAMADFAKKQGYKKVGICYVDNAGTKGPAEVFRSRFEQYGLEISAYEVLPQGSSDARTQMTKILSTKPDAVYLLGYALELGTMISQFREQDVTIPILSFQVMEESKVLEIAGKASEGVIFTTPSIYESSAEGKSKNFIDKYVEKYQERPGIFSANAYDAVYVIKDVITKVGFDKEAVREALSQVESFNGATGIFDINKNGDSNQQPSFMIIKNGKIEKYK